MNQKNIDKLYQLILDDDDETLMGSQWEEMYCNEYDTPKSILDKFLDIYIKSDFYEVDDDLFTHPLVANPEEKIAALIRYLEKITEDLKDQIGVSKKVKEYTINSPYGDTYYVSECPNCGCRLDGNQRQDYCHGCGQKLEWED